MHLFADPLRQLQQRTWLLHWALFIFWNVDDGCTQLLELFLHDMFTVAMQVNSPHLLRCGAPLHHQSFSLPASLQRPRAPQALHTPAEPCVGRSSVPARLLWSSAALSGDVRVRNCTAAHACMHALHAGMWWRRCW
jgi:hypothetical protein